VGADVERGHLARREPVLARVQPVVRAEDEIRVVADPVRDERRPDSGDHHVDGLDGLRSLAERRINLIELVAAQRRATGEPPRRVGREVIEVRRTRRAQPGELVRVTGAGV
jgi:hypothetical protein